MSIRNSVKGLSADLVQAIATRVELFGLEWQQAREDLPRLLALWVVGLLALLFALALFTLLIIVLAWDTPYRDWVVLALCLVYAIVGATLLWQVRQRIRAGGLNPFAVTIEELQRDMRLLAQQGVAKHDAEREDNKP
ncbi:MAG: phage holin family protein [Burkholderiaceae bacterium]|nr:phage holin family protein [Burkholderiaceae bacterium]MCD8517725.1 phage holin family protein [Burkholderiaceae bacterium]MCD8536016.1 phage holin family protein [Burkholderiaceae bacterium]MCD8564720.1 phage holin family protein [Burkholderiaceae bacterium]